MPFLTSNRGHLPQSCFASDKAVNNFLNSVVLLTRVGDELTLRTRDLVAELLQTAFVRTSLL